MAPEAGLRYRLGYEPAWAPLLAALYQATGMGQPQPEALNQAFGNSHRVASAWAPDGQLCGAARLLSDGVFYACVFDVAVCPKRQGQGIGKALMALLEAEVPGVKLHLTATFGKEGFYRKLGYAKHRTAMAKYPGPGPWPYLLPWPDAAEEAEAEGHT